MSPFVAFWEPKAGTARSEWEDGCAYSPESGWFAVTDGASAGTSSREWAYTLAKSFVDDRNDELLHAGEGIGDSFHRWLAGVRESFDPDAEGFVRAAVPEWVRVAGEQRGAFSTFLGGRITTTGWAAIAVGDCCLFHLRTSGTPLPRLVATFPLTSADELGSTPQLIPSAPADDGALVRSLRQGSGTLQPGDVILAGTDAVSEWMLSTRDQQVLWGLLSQIGVETFTALCAELRERREMRNDDVTLLRHRRPADRGGDR
jgi:hypothetical protein